MVIVEEGPLRSSSDFRQRESEAYPALYQEAAARKTADQAVTILQGRCVGGSTTVNWTSSFRTPPATLAVWRERHGLAELTEAAMAPWFAEAEKRLSIGPWLAAPNENNDLLRRGAERLGIPAAAIQRNVQGCWNLGSCGLGCPTEADCTHAPEDEDEQDAEDQREADFDPDFGWMDDFDGREADRAADLWERNFWGD